MKNNSETQDKLCILVFPFKNGSFECGQSFLTQYSEILSNSIKNILIIGGNYNFENLPSNIRIINVKTPIIPSQTESTFSKIFRLIFGQIFLTNAIIKNRREFSCVNIYMWTGAIFIPSLTSRILGKELWLTLTGSPYKSSKAQFNSFVKIFSLIIWFIQELNYFLANKIFLSGSKNMIDDLKLERYSEKLIQDIPNFLIDTEKFCIQIPIGERENIIGYVGRLSSEKGVEGLIESIPLILEKNPRVLFHIVGDGPLMPFCKRYLEEKQCLDRVVFFGWIDHSLLNQYFNRMKIHILPSVTEALGGTSLEAMASGTISLVSPAGGLKDTITDGFNGFVMENNSPESIAKKTLEILAMKNLAEIQINAREYVVTNFSYDIVISKWRKVLCEEI